MFSRIVFWTVFSLFVMPVPAWASPRVVVSIAPLHSIVSAVMEGAGGPELLLKPNVSVHGYSLKPSDMQRLASADVVFWAGKTLETFLVKAIQAAKMTDKNVAVMADPRLTLYPAGEEETSHADIDGHFWLDPENMVAVASIVAEKLSVLDPENATLYQKNAARVRDRLRALEQEGKKLLEPYKRKPYVVFHDAFQYFEKKFALFSLGALSVDPHHTTGAASLSEIRQKMREAGTVCLFSEPQFSDKKAKIAAEGLPVVFGQLDPAGMQMAAGKDFYPMMMRALFRSFVDCLSRLPE